MNANNITNIENAFFNVKSACETQLNKLYPAGIPAAAQERFDFEIKKLEQLRFPWINSFEIFRLLCKEARKSMQYLAIDTVDASSFLVHLLSENLINPLPPHYYCTNCGYYEEINTNLFGIDLPEKTCPDCFNTLRKDGYNLHPENVWHISANAIKAPNLACCTTLEFLPFAKRVLEKAFPSNQIVPTGVLDKMESTNKIVMAPRGFCILPTNTVYEDYPQFHGYLEDGTPCLCDALFDPYLFTVDLKPDATLEQLVNLQRKTGLYLHEISIDNISSLNWTNIRNTKVLSEDAANLLWNEKPRTFHDMVSIIAILNNSFRDFSGKPIDDCDFNRNHFMNSDTFQKYPCTTREDFLETFQKLGIDLETAYRLSETIRKGRLLKLTPEDEIFKKMYQVFINSPSELQEIAKQYSYVGPRAYAIHKILTYAQFAYYQKTDSKIYGSVLSKYK